jgi:cation:H+ antiporter
VALGSLLSSKLNQWTLLVGMIPGVFALSSRQLGFPLPMDSFQMHEILLTAAQSLLGVAILASLRLSWRGAILLFVLFLGQLVLPSVVTAFPSISLGLTADKIHPLFSILYLIAASAIFIRQPKNILDLRKGLETLPTK